VAAIAVLPISIASASDCTNIVTKASVTKTAAKPAAGSLASISDLNSLFRSVYGRNPTASEWKYWATRLLDKSDRTALVGAMAYHRANKILH
jgi:hypothetical protein